MMLEIIHDNDEFLVFSKPAGLSFHSEEGAGFVVKAEQQTGLKLYSVHRLDKMTSGLLLLAKSSEVANKLTKLFETRKIQKFYLAISLRKPKKKQGWIKGDMGSARRGSYKFLKTNDSPAITQFHSTSLREGERLFLVKPHTGKTHQIRVALKSIGSPIAGDIRYAATEDAKLEERGYLHAYALSFIFDEKAYYFVSAPKSGERFLSEDCTQQLLLWNEPWSLFKQK